MILPTKNTKAHQEMSSWCAFVFFVGYFFDDSDT